MPRRTSRAWCPPASPSPRSPPRCWSSTRRTSCWHVSVPSKTSQRGAPSRGRGPASGASRL